MSLSQEQRRVVEHLRNERTVRIQAGTLNLEFDDADRLLGHEIAIAIQGFWARKTKAEEKR